ncbi:hypothetical protein B0H14DRAFT_3747929, partial [Mycena olivaceomarginata]
QKGGSLLQDCLRNLWEKAVTIGFNYGEENLARVREEGFCEGKIAGFTEGVESERSKTVLESTEAAALHEKALEAERVWGYDIGWKLCSELQGGVQEAGTALSVTPPRLLCVAATQTDPVTVPPLDWAEDGGSSHISSTCTPLVAAFAPVRFLSAVHRCSKAICQPSTSPSPPPSHAYHIPATFITPYCYPTTALACIFSNLTALATFMAHPACHIQFFFVDTVRTTSRAARLGSRSPPT